MGSAGNGAACLIAKESIIMPAGIVMDFFNEGGIG